MPVLRARWPIACVVPAFWLAGCGASPATTLLTLDAVAPAPAQVHAGYRGRPIAVPAVHLPAALDRPEFVRHLAAGQEKVDDFAHWSAPLGLLARDALVRDLVARLPAGAVLPPGSGGEPDATTLDVTILSFDAGAGGATMQVAWRSLPGGPVRDIALTAPAPAADPIDAARAFGDLMGQLADRLAAALETDPPESASGGRGKD